MEQKIKLPLALLRAACIAASEDDFLRPNIESVVIDQGHIVATDGCLMFWAKLDQVSANLRIVIPRIHVECFIKKTVNFNDFICDLVYDPESKHGYFEIPYCVGCYEAFKPIFTDYVNWQMVLAANTLVESNDYPQFQTAYHARLDDIALELGNICRPKIIPNGLQKAATIEFLHSEFDNVHACLMPLDLTFSKAKYCVEILNESDDAEYVQLPAASAAIALRAVQRLRKDISEGFNIRHSNYIRPALWQGSPQEHQEKMFYTEDWFNQPLRKYNTTEKAIEYMAKMDEVVQCYVGDFSITARTVDDVKSFFAAHTLTKVSAVND